eukprot:2501197-Prymnesium_polylepis.1
MGSVNSVESRDGGSRLPFHTSVGFSTKAVRSTAVPVASPVATSPVAVPGLYGTKGFSPRF